MQFCFAWAQGAALSEPNTQKCRNLPTAEESSLRQAVGRSLRIFEGSVASVQATPKGVIAAGVVQQFQIVNFRVEKLFKGEWPDQSIGVPYMIGTVRGPPTHAGFVLDRAFFKVGRRLVVFTYGDERVFSGLQQNVEAGLTLPASNRLRLCLTDIVARH